MQLRKDIVSENVLQSIIFQWHWNHYPSERGLLFHVQQKARNAIEGAKFKAMGVVPGVSDMIYLRPGGRPVMIEFKIESGTQSESQRNWQAKAEAAGYEYRIVRSLEESICIFSKNN